MIIASVANVAAQTVQDAGACWCTDVAWLAADGDEVGVDGAEGTDVAAAATAVVAGGLSDVARGGLPDEEREWGDGFEEWLGAEDLCCQEWKVKVKEEGEDEEGETLFSR